MRRTWTVPFALLALVLAGPDDVRGQDAKQASHALSLFDDIKYPADFAHFDYADPTAPKGGEVKLYAVDSFDSLNSFILRGVAAAGLGYLYDQLMVPSADEPSTEYGAIAESAEVPDDLAGVVFNLRPEARWHDGTPITAEDVVYSFEIQKEKGHPFFRAYYANVEKAVALGPHRVKFSFTGPRNRELPTIMAQMTVLPKHYWEGRDFAATTLEPPLGSGPYRIASVDPGRSITYERVPDYWGRDLAVNQGRYNFERITFEYYRDQTVALEAFKTNAYDFRAENNSKEWATQYDFPARKAGLVVTEEVAHERPTGMQAFVFNIRRDKFKDRRVREALGHAFDFEWSNRTLFYGQYERTKSYFSNSELAARALPDEAELKLLEPYRGQIPDEVFTEVYAPPSTDGSGNNRANLRAAVRLLKEAGWSVENGKLTGPGGAVMEIEILLVSPAFERIVGPFIQNLKRLGVEARIRTVETAQYQNRLDAFDFDMIVGGWGQSLSPGNEQRDFWSSAAADEKGSRNYAGIEDPVLDALIDKVIFADSRAELVTATRALDRVLVWGHYVIPQWHIRTSRIAYWDKFARPEIVPRFGIDFDFWWVDAAKAAALAKRKATLR